MERNMRVRQQGQTPQNFSVYGLIWSQGAFRKSLAASI